MDTKTTQIRQAKPIDVIAELNFPEVEPLIDGFAKEINTVDAKKYLTMVLCNALYTSMCGTGFYVSRDCHVWAAYNKTTTLKEQKISVRKLNAVLDFLVNRGYLKEIKGHKDLISNVNNYRSRYFATEALTFIFNTKNKAHKHIFNTKHTNTIRLKKNKHDIKLDFNSLPTNILAKKHSIESLNSYYSDSVLVTCIKNNEKKRLRINLQSVYTEDWEHGGRLYATCTDGNGFTYQTLKKAERKTIEINGEATVEPDFHCLHINLAYNLNGKELVGDAYDFVPDRKFAKKVILISLNCTSRNQAINAILENPYVKHKYNYLDVELAISRMLDRHSAIREHFFVDDNFGLRLQNADSELMLSILELAKSINIPIIPVHDSCICRESDVSSVITLMRTCYHNLTRHNIEISYE